jgi:glyoxylase-like metal-dependent hydrolase (beta-lactamase superfamily II)
MKRQDEGDITVTGALQHAAWMRRTLPPVESVAADLWSIPVPSPPANPLRYVSVYVLASDSGLTLIDAGWGTQEAWDALCSGLTGIGATIADVSGCLVTHQHFDHIGLARRVREASGAWIALHPADRDAIMREDFRNPAVASAADLRWLLWLGAPHAEAARLLRARLNGQDPRASFAIPDRLIEDSEQIDLPGWRLRAVHTPGHTPGHLCFVAPDRRLLFAGDHVLPRISPNISADRRANVNALGDFLDSLDKIAPEPVDEVLPAHEWRFSGLRERTKQLAAHHQSRLDELFQVVSRRPNSAPWDLAGELTWSRRWEEYDGYMRIAAVNETLAHLVHLQRLGRVAASHDRVPCYRAVGDLSCVGPGGPDAFPSSSGALTALTTRLRLRVCCGFGALSRTGPGTEASSPMARAQMAVTDASRSG